MALVRFVFHSEIAAYCDVASHKMPTKDRSWLWLFSQFEPVVVAVEWYVGCPARLPENPNSGPSY